MGDYMLMVFKSFLESAQLSRKKDASEAVWEPRVFFLGNGGSGKTNLINIIGEKPFNAEEPKTDGVQVIPDLWRELSWMKFGDKKIDHITVWDFAGQEYDHIFSNFLIRDTALYIIVLDARTEDRPDEWLNYIQNYAPSSKVMIVVNKIDDEHLTVQSPEDQKRYNRLNIAQYHAQYDNIIKFYRVSCKKLDIQGNELEILKQDICEQIISMEKFFFNKWPVGSQSLRDWMRNDTTGGYISRKDFFIKYQELGLDSSKSGFTLQLCKIAGLCIYDEQQMKDKIILKPQWLTHGITKLLKSLDFNEKKWELDEANIIKILEQPDEMSDNNICSYKEYEITDLIDLWQSLKICVKDNESDNYIFPCFLPYYTDIEAKDTSFDLSDWYELQFSYEFLPPNIFTELQAELWNKQWNKILGHSNRRDVTYRDRIVVRIDNKKMFAWKNKNNIILAIQKDNNNENLSDEEREAMKKLRQYLTKINKSNQSKNNSFKSQKITENIVLKGFKDDPNMKSFRYPYDKVMLKKICMAGGREHYFPEVERWYNAAGLLIDEYNDKKIKDIYKKHLIHVFEYIENDDDEYEPSKETLGTGFLIPYNKQWYVICCAHELYGKDLSKIFFENSSKDSLDVILVGKLYPDPKVDNINTTDTNDIAVYRLLNQGDNLKHVLPVDILPFPQINLFNSSDSHKIYCQGYESENMFRTIENIYISTKQINDKTIKILKTDSGNGVFCPGCSGAPLIDLGLRYIIGMLRSINSQNNEIIFIPIEKIFNFIESIKNNNL